MKNKFLGVAGLLLAGVSLQASTTLTMSNPLITSGLTDGNESVSPYTGYLANYGSGSTAISLYCDDAADTISPPSTYTADVTAITAAGNGSNTRFGSATGASDASGSVLAKDGVTGALPTGVNLYEDLAWLYTQMAGYNTNNASDHADIIGMQEAAWDLTSTVGPQSYSTQAAEWVNLALKYAASDPTSGTKESITVNGTTTSLTVYQANYANWVVITPVSAVGCTAGGGTGCSTSNQVGQEFLANIGTGVVTGGSAAPEPATFGLFGSALLFGGMIARRRRKV